MKHYWINIDRNVKRQQFMLNQFQKSQIENYRVSAVTPQDFDNILAHERPLTCKYPGCTTCEYEFACLCSHIKAMQEGLKSDDEYFVIMEDDIHMPFVIDYDGLVNDIPKDTEILQMLILYGNTVAQFFKLFLKSSTKYIKWKYLLPSTGMYLISRKGAQRLVNMFYDDKNKRYNFHSSPYQIVADVLLYETAKTYATSVPYCFPDSEMGSEIHPDHLTAQSNAVKVIKEIINYHHQYPFPFVKKLTL